MAAKLSLLSLAAILFLTPVANAGEIVSRTFTNSKGEKVSGYVFQAGSSRRSYSRSRSNYRYPAFRSSGYTYPLRTFSTGRGYYTTGRYGTCRPVRPALRTTRTNITCNVARPIVIGRGVRVVRRR